MTPIDGAGLNRGASMISGTSVMGMSFATETSAAVANLIEYVTAGGFHSRGYAIRYLVHTKAGAICEEMRGDGWEYHELLEVQGEMIREAALEELRADD